MNAKLLFGLGLAALAALPAQGVDLTYDFVACSHSTQRVLEGGPDGAVLATEGWGVVASSTTPDWASATTRCIGTMRVAAGKTVGKGYCRWVQAGGDTALGEWEMTPNGENTWTWLSGTGKLAGIKGGGSFQWVTRSKPVEAGTSQSCRRDWGKATLP